MKSIFIKLTIAIVLLSTANKSFAWGKDGHHLTVEVAFHYMDDKTKDAVKHYLGKMSIDDAATWMDDIKSNDFYNYMRSWHYVDVDKGKKFENKATDRNAVIILNSAIKILENRENLKDSKIKEYIMIIFHLVGDLHQPLHTGYSVDKGGNTIMIESPVYSGNLHSFWDGQIIQAKNITLEDCLKESSNYTAEQIAAFQKINVIHWMNDSRSYLDDVYDFKDGKITQAYIDKNAETVKKQIFIGGLRLAAVLKEIFGTDHPKAATDTTQKLAVIAIPEPAPVAEVAPKMIKLEETTKYVGEIVKVCTKIYGGKYIESSKAPTLLNAGADFPDNPLTLVIWSDKRANFKNPPEVFYKGKDVCVTGKVQLYKGKPEIVVTAEEQIQLNNAASSNK